MNRLLALSAGLALLASSQVFASGYEKSIPWGGRSAGMGGIATPYIQGSQALFFNPAGLVSDRVGQDVTLNVTPLQAQFEGPIAAANTTAESENAFLTPFGLIYSATLNEKWGFGIGGYSAGGAYANYENIAFTTPAAGTTTVKTDLKITEIAAGAGYQVTPDLKVGAAVRLVKAQADLQFVQRATSTVLNPSINDMEDTQFGSFKIGAQYKLGENTQLGLAYRSQVKLAAKGKFGGQIYSAAPIAGAIREGDATAETIFPQQISLGATHKYGDKWTSAMELVWTEYSKVDKVQVTGNIVSAVGSTVAANPAIQQRWSDQWNLRLGGEYGGYNYPIRFGYVYTSKVTAPEWARASFTPPAAAHSFTVGSTYAINDSMQLDGALEYTSISGEVGAGNSADILAGEYSATTYGAHLGLSYLFEFLNFRV